MSIEVTGLYFYPVKSCGGTAIDTANFSLRGIEFDREWLIVDDRNNFITQRQIPKMCRIKPSVSSKDGKTVLKLQAPDMPDLDVETPSSPVVRRVTVWSDKCRANDQGDDVATWLSSYLQADCRLVRMADDYKRTVDQRYAKRKTDQVGFADGYPVLIASEESLDDLNNRLEQPLPMNRFRPNLVLKGASAFAEDSWKTIRVGDITFDIVKPCARCVITTIDQKSGEKGSEPLKTMASFRLVRNKAMFGMNAVHHTKGVIRIGDRAEILQP